MEKLKQNGPLKIALEYVNIRMEIEDKKIRYR